MATTDDRRRLDVRDAEEPFGPISEALEELDPDETLVLVNSFEPVPLYDVLDRRGFDHDTTRVGPEEFHVEITHR